MAATLIDAFIGTRGINVLNVPFDGSGKRDGKVVVCRCYYYYYLKKLSPTLNRIFPCTYSSNTSAGVIGLSRLETVVAVECGDNCDVI